MTLHADDRQKLTGQESALTVARQHTDVRNGQLMKVGRRVFLAGMVVTATGCQNMIRRGQSP
ncbi:MAG: hypothetical protein ACI87E_001725, partial [Mariniblastus sp.]